MGGSYQRRTSHVDLGHLGWEHTRMLHCDRRENRAPWFLFAFFLNCVPYFPATGLLHLHVAGVVLCLLRPAHNMAHMTAFCALTSTPGT